MAVELDPVLGEEALAPAVGDGPGSDAGELGPVERDLDWSHVGLRGKEGADVEGSVVKRAGASRSCRGWAENDRWWDGPPTADEGGGVCDRDEEGVPEGVDVWEMDEVDGVWVMDRFLVAGASVDPGGVGKKDVDAVGSDIAGGVGRGRIPLSWVILDCGVGNGRIPSWPWWSLAREVDDVEADEADGASSPASDEVDPSSARAAFPATDDGLLLLIHDDGDGG